MSNKPSLILIGAGGHSRSCIDVIEQHGRFQIAGLVGVKGEMKYKQLSYEVIGTDEELPELVKTYSLAVITLGHIHTPDTRIRLYHLASSIGFELPIIVSPLSYVSQHATIGAGTIVMNGAFVNARAKIGCNCIINTRAVIEHDVNVSDHCHISTGAILNGNVHVGEGSFIGSGSIVKEGVAIGQRSVVGMGLALRRNVIENSQYSGNQHS